MLVSRDQQSVLIEAKIHRVSSLRRPCSLQW